MSAKASSRTIADQWLREILGLLYQRRSLTRAEIIEATGLNAASVSHALRYLLDRGIVLKVGELASNGAGRPRELVTLNGETGYFVAVDLEGDAIRFALSNFLGDIRCRWEKDLRFGEPLRIEQVVNGIQRVVGDLSPSQLARVIAVGVSYPGTLDPGGLLTAVNLGWAKFPLVSELSKAFELPVFLEHDKHTCIEAERWLGALTDRPNGLFIICERGIGLGICQDGKPMPSWRNMAGELGHCKFDPAAQDMCRCGQRGCLEAIASSPNIVRQYLERTGSSTSMSLRVTEVFEKARRGDRVAKAVLDRAAEALGRAISNLVHLFNPEIVILGGDLIAGEDLMLPMIRDHAVKLTLANLSDDLKIDVSSLGLDIRLRGAATLAFRNSLADQSILYSRILEKPANQLGRGRARRQASA